MFKRIILGFAIALLLWLGYEWITFPNVSRLAKEPPQTTAFMEQRRKQLRAAGKDDAISYRWVPYGSISPSLRRAVLVAEDDTFYEHGGVDPEGGALICGQGRRSHVGGRPAFTFGTIGHPRWSPDR